MSEHITYDLSLQKTKDTSARHWTISKHRDQDAIVVYLPKVAERFPAWWEESEDAIVIEIITLFLLERVCLAARINNRVRVQQGLGKKLIKGRCAPYQDDEGIQYGCKMWYLLHKMFPNDEGITCD